MRHFGGVMLWILGVVAGLGLVNFSPMLSIHTPGMNMYEAEGITVYAVEADADEVPRIAGRIADSRDRVVSSLGDAEPEVIDVVIYPNAWALKRKTIGLAGVLLPDWYIGKNTDDSVLIVSPEKPGPSHTRESVEQAAVHEFVHVLTDRQHKQMGYWLKEGFALYLAQQKPNLSAVRAHRDITYEEFSTPNAMQFANVGGYSLAYKMMEYLETEYGWEKVLGFLTPGTTYEDVTGITKQDFFTQWKGWLETL